MKKNRKLKNKIAMIVCGTLLPASVGGIFASADHLIAKADSATSNSYIKSYVKEVSLSNSNFNSSSSSYTLSKTLTGWTGQVNDGKTTAGVINTGSSFQSYFNSTYHLANNPLTKGSDKYVMMINSRTKDSSDFATAKQGYKSSNISLDANSYYSFQVSFKSDSNYKAETKYVKKGTTDENLTISKNVFKTGYTSSNDNAEAKQFGQYISFSYKGRYYYLHKQLSDTFVTLTSATGEESYLKDAEVFYEDGQYVGVLIDPTNSGSKTPYYISVSDFEDPTENDNKVDIKNNAKAYTCKNITYVPTGANGNGNYLVSAGTEYFESSIQYNPISSTSFGSVYLSGLEDENGKPVKADFVEVSSKDWTTFYFFVATGNKAQTVTLDLWLGAKDLSASGVVFYDDCHVVQYSENAFWKTYQNYFGKTYNKNVTNEDGTIETVESNSTTLLDLRQDKTLDFSSHNFDFEEGIYNEDYSSLKNWTKDEKSGGNARIFNVNDPAQFKKTTGFDFVGSNLSCNVNLDGEKVEFLQENQYVLGLWAKNNYVKVKSQDVDISSNEIYKIKAYYKVSSLSSGSAYMLVEENDEILSAYNLKDTQYSLAKETASSGVSTNGENQFENNYGFIEFYVKGSALYNSSVNISLALGNETEKATGCVVFDEITVQKATSEQFSSASNKLELGTIAGTPSVSNGNFNSVSISNEDTRPYAPDNWTITKGSGTTFAGVINTDEKQYAEYVKEYNRLRDEGKNFDENPYYWASWANPLSPNNSQEPNNILMLANISKSAQSIKSDAIKLEANTVYKLSFDFKTHNLTNVKGFKLTLLGEDGFKLFEKENVCSDSWEKFDIFIKSFAGTDNVYLQIDLDTTEGQTNCLAYFDNFRLESGVQAPDNGNVVDLTNFFLDLPTNDISTSDPSASKTPAYSISSTNGNVGIVKSEKFDESSNFTIYTDESEREIDKNQNVFFLQSQSQGSHTLQSNFNLNMTANNYYILSFKLKTYFNEENLDKDKKYSYGATVGLTNFEYAKDLKSEDEYATYTLFFHPSSDVSEKLYIALVCDANETAGAAAIYDFKFEQSTEDDFKSAKATTEEKGYDLNKDKVFVASANETDEPDKPDSTPDTKPTGEGFDWLLIPSLIFGIAIIIAVVGFFLRKIKLKKIEIKKRESYDRRTSLNVDAIKLKARKEQEARIAEVENTISKFTTELNNLEKEHKQKVLALRAQDKEQVSKQTDKEFKQFAQKRTVISEKIESLQKQIEEMKTADFLLNLERKFYAQDEMKQRELKKASIKANKQKNKKAE